MEEHRRRGRRDEGEGDTSGAGSGGTTRGEAGPRPFVHSQTTRAPCAACGRTGLWVKMRRRASLYAGHSARHTEPTRL